MRNLKTEQIAAANYPYFKYSLNMRWTPWSGWGLPEWSFMHVIPIFMWTMQGCLR